jgi:uncharacterized alkaline shock family protein YloU
MEGHASISTDVLCRYAADAVRQVDGVRTTRGRPGIKLEFDDGHVNVEIRVAVDWGASIPNVGRAVQERVREYLGRMAGIETTRIDVVVDKVGVA